MCFWHLLAHLFAAWWAQVTQGRHGPTKQTAWWAQITQGRPGPTKQKNQQNATNHANAWGHHLFVLILVSTSLFWKLQLFYLRWWKNLTGPSLLCRNLLVQLGLLLLFATLCFKIKTKQNKSTRPFFFLWGKKRKLRK